MIFPQVILAYSRFPEEVELEDRNSLSTSCDITGCFTIPLFRGTPDTDLGTKLLNAQYFTLERHLNPVS